MNGFDAQKISYSRAERDELERRNPDHAIEWYEMTQVGGPYTYTILSIAIVRRVTFGDTMRSDGGAGA